MSNLNNDEAFSSSLLFNLEHSNTFHNESIAFLCVINGKFNIKHGSTSDTLHTGDIILLKDVGTYELYAGEKSIILGVFFDYIFFSENFMEDFDQLNCNSCRYPGDYYDDIFTSLIKLAISHTTDHHSNRFLILNQIFSLFHILKANCILPAEEEKLTGNTALDRQTSKLKQFKTYMKSNHMNSITLQDAADHMRYTPQYLSNFIKKQLGCTFNTYLNTLRLEAAVRYLKFRDIPVDQISFLCGFANPAAFQKVFTKEYRITPEQYRDDYIRSYANHHKQLDVYSDASFIRDYLTGSIKSSTPSSTNAIESINNIHKSFNIEETRPLNHIWLDMINLGNAENFDYPTFREHLMNMQNEVHFKYGRVTNILSIAIVYTQDNRRFSFNFTKIFNLINFMLSIGLKPHLDLGDKAFNIYIPHMKAHSSANEVPDSLFKMLTADFVKNIVNHYGYDEVSSWRFEFWQRYETTDLKTVESPAKYFERFSWVYTCIKNVVPDALIGAPGYNAFGSISILDKTLSYMAAKDLYPDFISAYIFPFKTPDILYGDETTPRLLEENPDYFSKKLNMVREVCIKNGMGNLPVYITEFSTHIQYENYFNDSTHQASFILRQYLNNWQQVSSMAYWLATDYAAEYPHTNQFLFGGNGIISQEGVKKPGYHAFGFLSMLGQNLIGQGDNYIITASENNRYQVILYSYAHFTTDFCSNMDSYDLRKHPESALEEISPIKLDLKLSGLEPGDYKISSHLLNNEHGSIYNDWRNLDYFKDLNDFEKRHLRSVCVPEMSITSQYIDGSFSILQKLYRNEIYFITIEKIY